jgi:hypothetical protein
MQNLTARERKELWLRLLESKKDMPNLGEVGGQYKAMAAIKMLSIITKRYLQNDIKMQHFD